MIRFVLNEKLIETNMLPGSSLLDFIRYKEGLKGTKIGCREGDCGACSVLAGTLSEGNLKYQSIVSCLTPLANVHGKHIVTVEGLNRETLNPVQQALVEKNGTQCGFCTPGFVISLTSFLLCSDDNSKEDIIASIDGNICRCTGYKSIERAADSLLEFKSKIDTADPVGWLTKNKYLPDYFLTVKSLVKRIPVKLGDSDKNLLIIGGGTDLMVQQPDQVKDKKLHTSVNNESATDLQFINGKIVFGSGTKISDLDQNRITKAIPGLKKLFKLFASTPIRNMGTVAGNIVNASPIGDLSIVLLALDANLIIKSKDKKRKLPLREFFLDYNKTDLLRSEVIEQIEFLKTRQSDQS